MPSTLRLVALALGRDLATVAWPEEGLVREGPQRGVPVFDDATCNLCGACLDACPSTCLALDGGLGVPLLDAGACVRCGACVDACGEGAVALSGSRDLASYARDDLVMDGGPPEEVEFGLAPSRLYRDAAGGGGRVVEPRALLEGRSRQLGSGREDGSGK